MLSCLTKNLPTVTKIMKLLLLSTLDLLYQGVCLHLGDELSEFHLQSKTSAPFRFACYTEPRDSWSSITYIQTDWGILHFWKYKEMVWREKKKTNQLNRKKHNPRSKDILQYFVNKKLKNIEYIQTLNYPSYKQNSPTAHWISFILLYYYHSLISKRICVVDTLCGALNVSRLTWIYQRQNVIIVMMLAAEQPSLSWVKGNTCFRRENIEESWHS